MFKNKYTARPEDHHYSHGKPNTNRDPPSTGYSRPPKSCNKTCYNKSRKVFEKTTKNRYTTHVQARVLHIDKHVLGHI